MDFLIAGWKWPQLDKGGVTVAKKEGGKKKDGGCQMAQKMGGDGGDIFLKR